MKKHRKYALMGMQTMAILLSVLLLFASLPLAAMAEGTLPQEEGGAHRVQGKELDSNASLTPSSAFELLSEDEDDLVYRESLFYYGKLEKRIAEATDVIKGRCVGGATHKQVGASEILEYEFEVLERYCGEETQGTIFVTIFYNTYYTGLNAPVGYYTGDISYNVGEDYYLILERHISVFTEHDAYWSLVGVPILPASNLNACTMYNQPLLFHSHFESKEDYSTEEKLEAYLINEINKTPANERRLFRGTDYIVSEDVGTIISYSPVVVKIKVGDPHWGYLADRCTHWCTITDVLKGEVEPGITTEIFFEKNDVEPGGEYIVAAMEVSDGGQSWYIVSSLNSVFALSDEEMIRNHIKEDEDRILATVAGVICGGAVVLAGAVAIPTVILLRKKRKAAAAAAADASTSDEDEPA